MSALKLLDAIYDDDQKSVKALLRADSLLATASIKKSKLYEGKILHWIYAGDTPLHLASAGHRFEIVRLLLARGADPNANGNHRQSGPLHYAADARIGLPAFDEKRQLETISCLLEAGAKINATDKNGATPLHRAVRTRGAAAVRFLLKSGADPRIRNHPGSTAFHLAVHNTGASGSGSEGAKAAQRRIIEAFLTFGISLREKDGRGQSVLDSARSEWIRELLKR